MSRYDPLLDDFEEDSEVTVSSGFKKSTGNSDGANQKSKASKNAKAEDTKEPDDEELAEVEEQESWSDDPVRMYLTQMGEIPLLTRVEEIRLAKRIEDTRRDFRAKLLESDYVFQMAFKILRRVHLGDVRPAGTLPAAHDDPESNHTSIVSVPLTYLWCVVYVRCT